jgi:N,N-dimethylformamidase
VPSPRILTSYTDRLSYRPGDPVTLHVSSPTQDEAAVELVRLNRAPNTPPDDAANPTITWAAAGRYPVGPQTACVGSFMTGHIPAREHTPRTLTLGAHVWAASLDVEQLQVILATDDILLGIRGRTVVLEGSSPTGQAWRITHEQPLREHVWYLLGATIAEDGTASIAVQSHEPLHAASAATTATVPATPLPAPSRVSVAASHPSQIETSGGVIRGRAQHHFTGKIGAPFIAAAPLDTAGTRRLTTGTTAADVFGDDLLAAWDFALHADEDPNLVRSTVPGVADGTLINQPTRGVTGHTWTGQHVSFRDTPDQYAAVHFHDTDLADAGWMQTLTAPLPHDLPSGVYGIRIHTSDATDTVPLFVVPKPDTPRHRVTVLIPTLSYLAYANEFMFDGLDPAALSSEKLTVSDADLAHLGDNTFGRSLYDHHTDGSGVMYSSAARPIVNLRHDYQFWMGTATRGFASDMYLIEWLDRRGIEYDIITDLELHQDNAAALTPANCVVTGSHPEYYTAEMLTALERYRDNGGRLMYLGGNGFYWVTGIYSQQPLLIEVRRGHTGVRAWESYPGEVTLVSTGEPAGLWRHRGKAPNRLVGIGFTAQGMGRSEPYHRTPAASDPAYQWIFDKVDEEPIGAYGRSMGGAAGDEIDRADVSLGTPADAVVLASSRGHTNFYQRVVEEVVMLFPEQTGGQQDPEVHADIVYFRTPAGGEVFSVGSIAWSGALLSNDCDNGISRITENVLQRFAHPAG